MRRDSSRPARRRADRVALSGAGLSIRSVFRRRWRCRWWPRWPRSAPPDPPRRSPPAVPRCAGRQGCAGHSRSTRTTVPTVATTSCSGCGRARRPRAAAPDACSLWTVGRRCGKHDRAPIRVEHPHGSGAEPDPARVATRRGEPGEAHPPAAAGTRPAGVPVAQRARQISQTRREASLEFSAHHGATSCLTRFHAHRSQRAGPQPTGSCPASSLLASMSAFT